MKQKEFEKNKNIKNIHLVYGVMHENNYCIERDYIIKSHKNKLLHEVLFAQSRNPQKKKAYV